jgi:hypothetical protein
MNAQTLRKLSIAFTIYNQSRAEARRHGDSKKLEAMNNVLGNLVKDAHRPARVFHLSINANEVLVNSVK